APICRRRPTPSTGRRSRTKSHASPADDGAVLYPRAPWEPVAATDGRFDGVGGADGSEGAASGGGSPASRGAVGGRGGGAAPEDLRARRVRVPLGRSRLAGLDPRQADRYGGFRDGGAARQAAGARRAAAVSHRGVVGGLYLSA